MKIVTKSVDVAGRPISFEVGRLAPRSTSSVLARYGDTVVHVAVTLGKEDLKKDYFPLSVEYQERLYAGGRIKGSRWVKREGKGTDAEILSGRLIDRSIRPLFPKNFKNEVQVIITVLSVDNDNDADILGVNAASAAIALSPIPWAGPVAAVRVGLVDDELVLNPKNGKKAGSRLDLVVTSTDQLIDMLEAGANQVSEELVYQGFEKAFAENKKIVAAISELASQIGKTKITVATKTHDSQLLEQVHTAAKDIVKDAVDSASGKPILEREAAYEAAREAIAATFDPKQQSEVKEIIDDEFTKVFRGNILEKKHRADGRKPEEIRPLEVNIDILPRVHGSATFQRGDTQVLTIATLGAPSLSQSLESAEGEETKRYMHHYNMPPYATGETGRVGQPGRREIGHGALAERALAPVIPPESEFPYAIRVVSEIMSSNGSTSMASTCGSTLSLMDAGVPLIAPVSGISTGLITPEGYPKKSEGYVLLTDITGGEDHHGDMDFKVAGTTTGITAIQLDVKVPGLTLAICKETLGRAKTARMQILETMLKVLPAPKAELSKYAPKISTTQIPTEKIGELIGPGGKNIKKLMADTETVIDVRDDGAVFISGINDAGVKQALSYIGGLGKEVMPGEIYEGTVARIQPFGAFVNILPGKDGLVHVSRMGQGFVSDPNQIVKEGDKVKVWVTEIDSQGRIALSMIFDADGKPTTKNIDDTPRPPRNFNAPLPRRSHDSFRR
jgi:polyribonucleotide nucleotidyltransferase